MLSYNEDAPRQEEINFRSFPAHSRLPVPAGSHVGACPAAPGAPQQGDCACKPSQLGALDESIVPAVQRSKASLGHSPGSTGDTACAGSPHPTPTAPPAPHKGSSRLSCGSVQNKTTSLAKVLLSMPWSRNKGLGSRHPWSWSVVLACGWQRSVGSGGFLSFPSQTRCQVHSPCGSHSAWNECDPLRCICVTLPKR